MRVKAERKTYPCKGGGDYHRQAASLEYGDDACRHIGVKGGGGFVEQEQARLHGEDAGQRGEAFFAAGEALHHSFCQGLYPQACHGFTRQVLGIARRMSLVERAEGHIFEHRRAEQLVVGILEQQSDRAA